MDAHQTRVLVTLAAAALLASPLAAQNAPAPAPAPAAAATAPAGATDTVLWYHLASSARVRALVLQPPAANENARVAAQYRDALADIERGNFGDALLTFQAIMPRARDNGVYQGDLAYALMRAGRYQDAENAYRRAFQIQQQNAWFLTGIAFASGLLGRWADAAGTIQLAAQTDSAIVSGRIPSYAAMWFEQAGDRSGMLAWARLSVRRDSMDAASWRRIAFNLSNNADTSTEGYEAIRRFRRLAPDDNLGKALWAGYLYPRGQADSALAYIAAAATADSAYWEYGAQLHLQVGREMVQARNPDRAIALLATGRPWASAAQRPAFSNLMGRAQLLKLNAALNALETTRACAPARAADSLAAETERNLRAGVSFDSARTTMMLEQILPQYKANAASSVSRCSDAPEPTPTPARPVRPAPRPRP